METKTMVYLVTLATHNSVLALVWVVSLSVLALITVLALTAARSPDADKRKAARKVLRIFLEALRLLLAMLRG
jgi:hypothetical protein